MASQVEQRSEDVRSASCLSLRAIASLSSLMDEEPERDFEEPPLDDPNIPVMRLMVAGFSGKEARAARRF